MGKKDKYFKTVTDFDGHDELLNCINFNVIIFRDDAIVYTLKLVDLPIQNNFRNINCQRMNYKKYAISVIEFLRNLVITDVDFRT